MSLRTPLISLFTLFICYGINRAAYKKYLPMQVYQLPDTDSIILDAYTSDRLLEITRPRKGPVDLIVAIPKGFSARDELGAAKEVVTKVLTLFTQSNPFNLDASKSGNTRIGLILYSKRAEVVVTLSQGIDSATLTSNIQRPNLEIERRADNLYLVLNAVHQQFREEGRPDATTKKVLIIFVSSETTGNHNVEALVDKLNGLGVEIYVLTFGPGSTISAETILKITAPDRVASFESYVRASSQIHFLLSTSVPIYKTRPTKYTVTYGPYRRNKGIY